MIEVSRNLWVGSGADWPQVEGLEGWYVLQCAKEPWHREAVGYGSKGCPRESPEYLFARRGNRLILNMVDAENPDYFADEMVNAGLEFIGRSLASRAKVLVHCNQGQSRGPGMALLFLMLYASEWPRDAESAVAKFREIYPAFEPKRGILGVIERRGGSKASDGWFLRME